MRKIIVLISLLVVLVSCNNIFDMYDGEDLYMIESYVHTKEWPCTWDMNKSISDYEIVFTFTEESITKLVIRLWTDTGNRYDWYSEYIYY